MPVDMEKEPRERQERTVSRFREILAQVLAMSAANMVVVVLTLALYFSTLVIAEVHNKEGPLCMDDTQASWFAWSEKEDTHGDQVTAEREIRSPLALIVLSFAICGFGGMYSVRTFIVEIQQEFYIPIDAMRGSVVITVMGFFGNLLLISFINRTGKHMCILVTTTMCAICCFILGLYAYLQPCSTHRRSILHRSYMDSSSTPLFATILKHNAGASAKVSRRRMFPLQDTKSSMAAASYYVMIFLAVNTYLTIERNLQLFGAFWFYGTVSVIGFVYLYFQLPETEGKTLEEIEQIFATKKIRRP